MSDLILEIIRATVLCGTFLYLWRMGKKEDIYRQKGWLFIIFGFGSILFGTLIDITDNFPGLNRFIIIGDTAYQAFFEKVIGYLFGFVLLAIGFWKWIPTIISLREVKRELKESHELLESKVRERTAKLNKEIMEHKQTLESLKNSEARFRGVVENTKNGVAVFQAMDSGKDFVFSDFNTAAERIESIKRADVIGKKVSDVFPGIKDFGLLDVFQRVWETGKPENHPVSMYKDERVIGWRENYVYKLPSGEIVAVYSDETERKQAEKSILESRDRLETILQSIPVGVVIIDSETHKIIDTNPKAVMMRGGPIEPGTLCHNIICPTEKGKCPITDLGQVIDESERKLIKFDGESVPVLKTVIPTIIDDKKCLIECFIDFSEHQRAEKERVKKEKLESVIEMAGAVCHELNQPLMILSGSLELLLMEMTEDNHYCSDMKRIKEQVDRMGGITRKLMSITSYKTKSYLNRKIIDLDAASNGDKSFKNAS